MRFIFFLSYLLFAGIAYAANQNYIVVLKQGAPLASLDALIAALLGIVLKPLQKFGDPSGTFMGFTANMTDAQAARLALNPNVSQSIFYAVS